MTVTDIYEAMNSKAEMVLVGMAIIACLTMFFAWK